MAWLWNTGSFWTQTSVLDSILGTLVNTSCGHSNCPRNSELAPGIRLARGKSGEKRNWSSNLTMPWHRMVPLQQGVLQHSFLVWDWRLPYALLKHEQMVTNIYKRHRSTIGIRGNTGRLNENRSGLLKFISVRTTFMSSIHSLEKCTFSSRTYRSTVTKFNWWFISDFVMLLYHWWSLRISLVWLRMSHQQRWSAWTKLSTYVRPVSSSSFSISVRRLS